ncbi:MAG TPA: DUF6152 family protein [Caulobacteraceae bacterium]|jgi:hypothetical protein|nr:DUF6152 family protein [Caulobacteraceae bacterium]
MTTKLLILAGAAVALAAGPAMAHHSGAMFDSAKQVTLEGTIKEFQFTNPHSWIQLNVSDGGKVTEWSLETGGVSGLYKRGIRASTLKPGDKVTIVVNPLKNGNAGGSVRTVTAADGKVIMGGGQG